MFQQNYVRKIFQNHQISEVNGNAVNYLIDESFVYPQVVSEYDDLGTVTTEYHRGLGLISMYNGINERFYRYDALGSVRALSDENSVTDTYDYDAYGGIRARTGTTENSFVFTGEQFDEETGNYYLRARYYNPSAGQFISRDSWEGDDRNPITLNKYAYANSNPVMFTDPSGRWGMMEVSAIQNMINTMASTSVGIPVGIPSPEKTQETDNVELFKTRYYAFEEHAAWDATNYINPRSISENLEYGGWVVKLRSAFLFYATRPTMGIKSGSWDPQDYFPDINKSGNVPTAIYHTHGAYDSLDDLTDVCAKNPNASGCVGVVELDLRERFSDPSDLSSLLKDRPADIGVFIFFGVNGYLGTPQGKFLKWSVASRTSFIHPNYPIVSIK